jgi:phage baseplate assembly protein W
MGIIGIAFPFRGGETSFPMTRMDADVIADNIQRILETRKGERPMRPNAGSIIWDFIFENTGAVLNARIDYEIRRALSDGEPRAAILATSVYEQLRFDGSKNIVVTVTWSFKNELRQTAVSYTLPSSG